MNDRTKSRHHIVTVPALAAVALLCILLMIPHTAYPLLYSPKMDAETALHDRVSVLRQVSQDNSAVVLPLMEDIFSSSGTLVLNLELKDFTAAERDLDEYLARSRQFDNLVIRLEMSQSDLEEWRRLNALNKEDLMALFEDTQRFSDLKRLEIEYRDADDPDMLYSIMYEGEALRSKIKETIASYEGRSEEMIAVSRQFEVKTNAYEQSIEDAHDIAESIEEEQEERSATIQQEVPPKEPLRVHLGIEPPEVGYGDTLTISGRVSGTDLRIVSLTLDSRNFLDLNAATDGTFLHREQIDRIRTGMHTLYATVDGAYSEVRSFRVIRSETHLTLQHAGGTQVTGRLMAGDRPVFGAPIRILSAGRQINTPTTGADGRFAATLKLSPGTHQIAAVFDDSSFPLGRSESGEVVITVTPPEEQQVLIPFIQKRPVSEDEDTPDYSLLFIATVLCMAGAAGFFYLKRRPKSAVSAPSEAYAPQEEEPLPEADVTDEIWLEDAEEEAIPSEPAMQPADPALEAYRQVQESDYPVALRFLFGALAENAGIQNPLTATAGDLRWRCPEDARLHAWLSLYERVLYGRHLPDHDERRWFEEAYLLIRGDRL